MRLSKTKITLFFSESFASSRKAFTPLRSTEDFLTFSRRFLFSLTEGESLPDFSRAIIFVGTLAPYSATGDVALPLRCQFPRLFIGRLYGSGYFEGIYLRRFSVFRIVFCRN